MRARRTACLGIRRRWPLKPVVRGAPSYVRLSL